VFNPSNYAVLKKRISLLLLSTQKENKGIMRQKKTMKAMKAQANNGIQR
jgi:hypothetical protein